MTRTRVRGISEDELRGQLRRRAEGILLSLKGAIDALKPLSPENRGIAVGTLVLHLAKHGGIELDWIESSMPQAVEAQFDEDTKRLARSPI